MLMHQFGYVREDGEIQAVVIPLWHKDNVGYNPNKAWAFVKEVLEDDKVLKVAHNAAFDLKYTRVTTGVEVKGVIADTMLLLHALNSGISGNYSLKTAVWDFLLGTGLGGYENDLGESFNELQEEAVIEIGNTEEATE
jgi:DNA polymerase I-like protein with 3'-5' exonuclease and polymerase domains